MAMALLKQTLNEQCANIQNGFRWPMRRSRDGEPLGSTESEKFLDIFGVH
jgi:hypothetical protein